MQQAVSLQGAVDLHGHCGPSPFPRRVDGYEYATEAARAGLDAVVLKEHFLPTVYGVPFIERLLRREGLDITPVGSVVLNYCNGGFNPFVVEQALAYGARVVWAPTIDARNHGEKTGGVGQYGAVGGGGDPPPEYDGVEGIRAIDDDGALREPVARCLDKVAGHGAVLAVGHLSFEETAAMVRYAVDRGGDVVVDHPLYGITDFDAGQRETLVSLGAHLNFPFAAVSPRFHWATVDDVYGAIRGVGVDNCVVSSDMGQLGNPSAPDGLRILGELLLEAGLSVEEYRALVETTPKALLGL